MYNVLSGTLSLYTTTAVQHRLLDCWHILSCLHRSGTILSNFVCLSIFFFSLFFSLVSHGKLINWLLPFELTSCHAYCITWYGMLTELQQVPDPFITWSTRRRDYTRWFRHLCWRDSSCFWWCRWHFWVFWRCTYNVLHFVKTVVFVLTEYVLPVISLCMVISDGKVTTYWKSQGNSNWPGEECQRIKAQSGKCVD